jgi:hypothetical protein
MRGEIQKLHGGIIARKMAAILDLKPPPPEGRKLATEILSGYTNKNVDSYASFAKSDRLFKLTFQRNESLRKSENAQLIKYAKNIGI